MSNYFTRLGNATSHFLNALSGGNPDIPASGRVGYHSMTYRGWWTTIDSPIDFTFYPADGSHHCHRAYERDADDKPMIEDTFFDITLSIFCVSACLLLAPIFYTIKLVKWLTGIIH